MKLTIPLLFLLGLHAVSIHGIAEENKPICGTQQSCKYGDGSCRCYCSFKCGPRKIKPEDNPIFVPNDPAGYYCYCQQRDLDYFQPHNCPINSGDVEIGE